MTDSTHPDLCAAFHDYVAGAIDEEGVYPLPMMYRTAAGQIHVVALAVPPDRVWQRVLDAFFRDGAVELLFGLDRTTREGQGTTLGDMLTCGHWKDGKWRVGIIEYQHEPRIVKPWNWENEFWNRSMGRMLATPEFTPKLRIIVTNADGTKEVFGRPAETKP